ncbi:diguanylate cyclase/phosphodiesterase [Solidesulfovibrio fructosivorans JJ]]|uniref:Diguanylate cyclase/phosphodiesterase n=1 Tax=Solidesulfovibrio fructosivorans JJ] TaxID=596151 RepID=E1JZT5_SOLFR|nr:GGDEF domain-containing protein [Solidesulfovibrio fructosivorans]EFL50115.1 diguanylate cyclase/phosphodiesterase [Solidesulfovibrio fructosivorans JJ]]
MQFSSCVESVRIPEGGPLDGCQLLGFLEREHRERVAGHIAKGGFLGLVLLEIQDFSLLRRLFRPEVAETLAGTMAREVRRVAGQRTREYPLALIEVLEPSRVLVIVGHKDDDAEALDRLAAMLRLDVRGRLRQESVRLTGQGVELRCGAARVISRGAAGLDMALASAVAEASRRAGGGEGGALAPALREFREILELRRVRAVFQPIVNLRAGSVFAWEALARGPRDSTLESPAMLFDVAEEAGAIFALEKICREAAIRGFAKREPGAKLFCNVHPRTLLDPQFTPGETRRLLDKYGMEPHDVVLEITERHSVKDFNLFHRTLAHYRDAGYGVAVDDVGTGYSGLVSIAEIQPDFMKIDMSLVRGIDANPVKRALMETLLTFSEKVGCRIVAEGIETEAELACLIRLGAHFGQGFFLGRPAETPALLDEGPRLAIVRGANMAADGLKCSSPINDLAERPQQVGRSATIGEVKQFFDENESVHTVVVTQAGRPEGLIMSQHLDKLLSSQYGLSLFLRRDVGRIMDPSPLAVEWDTPVEVAAQAAMARDRDKLYDPILVTCRGRLSGLVSVQKILDALASVQVEMAKGANPLTGLPGNVAIEREIARRAAAGRATCFIYADLDNFKVFNDVYGFKDGDKAILLTARILGEALCAHGGQDDFLGHVGGDDFVILCDGPAAEPICRAVAQSFAAASSALYTAEDRERGYIEGQGRDGRVGRFDLLTISMGVIDCAFAVPVTMDELGLRAAAVKKYAKAQPGNSFVRDRRAPLGLPDAPGQEADRAACPGPLDAI